MALHKLLLRQLSRESLNENVLPSDINQWRAFLDRINKSYSEADKERYLLERSMEISSRELNGLNQKLEAAQRIARLGYWYHDIKNGKNIWSKELYSMFGLNVEKPAPGIEAILELTFDQDRPQHKECIDRAFDEGLSYEIEIRMKSLDGNNEYRWYQIMGEPIKNEGQAIVDISGIIMDVTRRKQGEEEIALLHQQLISSARRAGMADVATSILHNVGNILNSANVSVELILEYISNPYYEKIFRVGCMIEENISHLSEYFTKDQKGKLIPQYLIDITNDVKSTQKKITDEVESLNINLKHIKDITAIQQSLSGSVRLIENIYIPDLIESAIKMCGKELEVNNIVITKQYDGNLYIVSDRSKLLQVIINLLQNAKDAIIELNSHEKKQLVISVKKNATDHIEIQVKDNGIGISRENLGKVFTFGFTTKETGHGFGLHSSAIIAKELGGKLMVKSDGLKQGASFFLTLPVHFIKDVQYEQKT